MTLALISTSAAPRLCARLLPFLLSASPVWADSVTDNPAQVVDIGRALKDLHLSVENFETLTQKVPMGAQKDLGITIAVSLSLHPDYLKNLAQSCANRNQGKTTCRLAVQGIPIEMPIKGTFALKDSNAQSEEILIKKALTDFSDSRMQSRVRILVREGLKKLSQATAPAGVEIDPQFFKDYAITSVPAFVFEHFENGQHVTTGVMTGAVTLDVAVDSAMERFEAYRKSK